MTRRPRTRFLSAEPIKLHFWFASQWPLVERFLSPPRIQILQFLPVLVLPSLKFLDVFFNVVHVHCVVRVGCSFLGFWDLWYTSFVWRVILSNLVVIQQVFEFVIVVCAHTALKSQVIVLRPHTTAKSSAERQGQGKEEALAFNKWQDNLQN